MTKIHAEEMNVTRAIVIDCTAKKVVTEKDCILDDCDDRIVAKVGDVIVSVLNEKGTSTSLKSNIDVCGGKTWKTKLEETFCSFEDMHKKLQDSNVMKVEEMRNTFSIYRKKFR